MDALTALKKICDGGIVAVLRGNFPPEKVLPVCEVLLQEGIAAVELTRNSVGWTEALPALRKTFGDALLVGVGTLLNHVQVREAIDGGAQFIVAPSLDAQSVSTAHAAGLLMAPGVATPTEAVQAAALGCKLIKFFPAGPLGVSYFKTMRGPLNDLAFMCNGGINQENIAAFIRAGAAACGVGGDALSGDGSRPLDDIRANAARLVALVRQAREEKTSS